MYQIYKMYIVQNISSRLFLFSIYIYTSREPTNSALTDRLHIIPVEFTNKIFTI